MSEIFLIYKCKNCLTTFLALQEGNKTELLSFCPYCPGESFLYGEILSTTKTKEECKKLYGRFE